VVSGDEIMFQRQTALHRWPIGFFALVLLATVAGAVLENERATLRGHTGWIGGVAFAPDGQTLATASADQTVQLWEVATGQEQATLQANAGEIRSVAWSPDGQTLAAGTRYGSVKIWRLSTRQELATLPGHLGDVWSVAFAPDGKTLVSGDGDWNR